tara:strand:- start:162 stop:419 length:258 start_codon:yes stop_codon:yes gene_type:complete
MKTNITICIDTEVYLALKTKKIVVSQLINNHLRAYLELKEEPKVKDLDQLKQKMIKKESEVVRMKAKIDKQEKEQQEKDKHIRWI